MLSAWRPGRRLSSFAAGAASRKSRSTASPRTTTKRAPAQIEKFRAACVEFGLEVARRGAALLVVGKAASPLFPDELRAFRTRQGDGIKVNLLVNYHWEWDLAGIKAGRIRSWEVPRLDLIARWGGGRRLSGFLPAQSAFADFYVIDDYWPDFSPEHLDRALTWFREQDRTLGG
jgi:undecaprenyl diphosphate synthase